MLRKNDGLFLQEHSWIRCVPFTKIKVTYFVRMVRGRGFEPLNPYGTRFPNTSLDVPELRVHMVRWVSRAFDLASPSAWFGSLAVGSYA